jgi:hypothetical protein
MEASAIWRVRPGADLERVNELVGRLAQELGWEAPTPITGDVFKLPPERQRIIATLDNIEPAWRTLLIQPGEQPP